jgi:hypothetical protein
MNEQIMNGSLYTSLSDFRECGLLEEQWFVPTPSLVQNLERAGAAVRRKAAQIRQAVLKPEVAG